MIRKKGHKWCVLSPNNPDWSGGCFKTKKEAEARLRQVEKFKHMNGLGGRLCWETTRSGLTWNQAKKIEKTQAGPFRLTFDERDGSWFLEEKKPCPPAHPMRRFMYRGLHGRRRRR